MLAACTVQSISCPCWVWFGRSAAPLSCLGCYPSGSMLPLMAGCRGAAPRGSPGFCLCFCASAGTSVASQVLGLLAFFWGSCPCTRGCSGYEKAHDHISAPCSPALALPVQAECRQTSLHFREVVFNQQSRLLLDRQPGAVLAMDGAGPGCLSPPSARRDRFYLFASGSGV